MISHGDIVDVITPTNILIHDELIDDDDDHDDCKCGATSGLGRTCLNIILQHAQTPAQGQFFEISQTTNPKRPKILNHPKPS